MAGISVRICVRSGFRVRGYGRIGGPQEKMTWLAYFAPGGSQETGLKPIDQVHIPSHWYKNIRQANHLLTLYKYCPVFRRS